VAPVLRLSVVLAATEVAVAVSHVLLRLGQFLQAAEEVAAREILLGVTEIFPRHAEVLGSFTAVIVAVASMVMMAVMAVVTMMVVVVVVVEQIVQETADEASRKTWNQTEHSYSPLSLGMPAPASCRRSRCLLTV
jgi:ABC-type cobalt transport system substrate-binding protein